jgi:hypothetical protein
MPGVKAFVIGRGWEVRGFAPLTVLHYGLLRFLMMGVKALGGWPGQPHYKLNKILSK